MVKKLTFQFGKSIADSPLEFEVAPVTVFVGPNNAGKSLALLEIENFCRSNQSRQIDRIVSHIDFVTYDRKLFERDIDTYVRPPRQDENLRVGNVIVERLNAQNGRLSRSTLNRQALVNEACGNSRPAGGQFASYVGLFTVRLDGKDRLQLLKEQKASDLQQSPQSYVGTLFGNNELRASVRKVVHEAFGKYFTIDPTKIGTLRVRLSEREPADEAEERGWDSRAVAFHSSGIEIEQTSDGVKAFIGIIATLIAGDPKVILIDEPEAFLHPALSAKLGTEISRIVRSEDRRLFASTHSASFLMGCIQAGVPINIVRLTYNYSVPTARLLPQEKLVRLVRNPLLRSTGTLNGLFYQSVVVTEADADRAFYQEVNERLVGSSDSRGIDSCLFINAQNKQTVWDIVRPLRELGIPAAGVVDIDALKDGGSVFGKILDSAFIPELSHEAIRRQRQAIKAALENSGRDMKRDGGIAVLKGTDAEAARNLFSLLAEYGVFLVPCGELESWLPQLGMGGHGGTWLVQVLESLGEDPAAPDYVHPDKGDVWEFIGQVGRWLKDGGRKGIPD